MNSPSAKPSSGTTSLGKATSVAPSASQTLTGHSRAAIGLLLAVTAIGMLWTTLLAWDLSDRRQTIIQKESELLALTQRASSRVVQGAARPTMASPFLDGATRSLASNSLQERVVRILEEAGANVLSVNIEPSSSAPDPLGGRLTLQALADATIDSLQKVLHRIEGEAPALFIDSLLIDRRTTGPAETTGTASAVRVRADMRISGFSRMTGQ